MKEGFLGGALVQPKTPPPPEGIKKLVQQWNKCIEKQGDCVEK